MFHGKHAAASLGRAAAWAGVRLDPAKRDQLADFATWLAGEGAEAGGIGPDETDRIIDRHVADSLTFAAAWVTLPQRILDVGAGVGLPGIPLAIAAPETAFTLVDRSGRRCTLARRAVRILELQNVTVEQRDIDQMDTLWPGMVFRASLPPDRALKVAAPRLGPGGCAVLGLSRLEEPSSLPEPPAGTVVDVLSTGLGVLDSPAWLLRMTRTDSRTKDGNSA